MHSLQPVFQFVDSKAIESECMKVYQEEKETLQKMMNSLDCLITIACDVWSFKNEYESTAYYMLLTARFVDNNWRLQKKFLGFSLIYYDAIQGCDAGDYVSECIFGQVQAWNPHGKLFCLSMDDNFADDIAVRSLNFWNGNYGFVPRDSLSHGGCCFRLLNSTALRKLKGLCGNEDPLPSDGFFHVGCCSQILNSVVKKALNAKEVVVFKLCNSIERVNFSVGSKQNFAMCLEKISSPKTSIILDEPTSWDSTFKMLGIGVKLKSTFKIFYDIDGAAIVFQLKKSG